MTTEAAKQKTLERLFEIRGGLLFQQYTRGYLTATEREKLDWCEGEIEKLTGKKIKK